MKKDILIMFLTAFLIMSLGIFWYYGAGADVNIADINASPVGVRESGQLDIVLQNNGSKPVDVWLEVENTFVDGDGVAYPASKLIISNYSAVSLQKPIRLLPGNNSVSVWIGYVLPGEYPVHVKILGNCRLLDEYTYLMEIPSPENPENLYLKLEYELENMETFDIYRIYGYLINPDSGSVLDMATNLSVVNERTGKTVSTSSRTYSVWGNDKIPLWAWPDYPYAIVEIAYGEPSGKSYMPVQDVVVGGSEDRFRVNVTSTWQDHMVSAELLLPPGEEEM